MIILDPVALEPDTSLMTRTPVGIACPREGECNTSTYARALDTLSSPCELLV